MKIFTTILLFIFSISLNAQEVNFKDTTYKIKGKTILQDGVDVTTTLSVEDQAGVWEAFNKEKALDKERKDGEKAIKKAEKEQKAAEKKQKKAEKELKAKEKAQSKFEDANDDHADAVKKYEKLKKKGKLSPNDEEKHLEKIKDLKEDIEKAKRKL
ncbi:hypothetical protein ACGK9U_10235 [Mariniflexile sp. HNIBRBA6329]|uniref:hypothetical protein n=1 Tax=Mariniflexile sp. HNIBRBA6329 TaxID=3373088 RepID=UPI003745DD7E